MTSWWLVRVIFVCIVRCTRVGLLTAPMVSGNSAVKQPPAFISWL